MLKRLAVVMWWLGSIVWTGTAVGCLYEQASQLYERHRCASVFAEHDTWQHKYDDAKARYESGHNSKPTTELAKGSTVDDIIPPNSLKAPSGTPESTESDPIDIAFPEPKSTNPAGQADLGDSLDERVALDHALPLRTGLKDAIDRCEATADKTYWFAMLGATVFALLTFSLAFVFGGQFWLPPKTPQ